MIDEAELLRMSDEGCGCPIKGLDCVLERLIEEVRQLRAELKEAHDHDEKMTTQSNWAMSNATRLVTEARRAERERCARRLDGPCQECATLLRLMGDGA